MKFTLLTATALLALSTGIAHAKDQALDLIDANTVKEQNAYFYEFDRDEQCQGYALGVKRLGITNACDNDSMEKVARVEPAANSQVLNEYVVYFDFDESNIRANDMAILRQAAREIQNYDPSEIAVVGYTDTEGSAEYNQALSARRANAVSNALTQMGVENSVVNKAARGESELAVPTADDVKMQENRRVAIQFLR
jgi:outer membrane protein OmpA-like peptidoglycan-associated protein